MGVKSGKKSDTGSQTNKFWRFGCVCVRDWEEIQRWFKNTWNVLTLVVNDIQKGGLYMVMVEYLFNKFSYYISSVWNEPIM